VVGTEVVGFVTYGRTKLANLHARPQISLTFPGRLAIGSPSRVGLSLLGPDDRHPDIDAGWTPCPPAPRLHGRWRCPDDWDAYDRHHVRASTGPPVLVHPTRIYSN